MFLYISFNIFTFSIADCANLLCFRLLSKLNSFLKLKKNSIILVIFDNFLLGPNYIVNSSIT